MFSGRREFVCERKRERERDRVRKKESVRERAWRKRMTEKE